MTTTPETSCRGAGCPMACRSPLTAKEVREKLVELFCLYPVVVACEKLQEWLLKQEKMGR